MIHSPVGSARSCVKRAAMVAVCLCAVFVSQGATTVAYEQKGLIHHWDAYENAGLAVHDSTAKVWKDLAGSLDLTMELNGTTRKWTDRSLMVNGCTAYGATATTDYRTLEVVYKMTDSTGRILFASGCTTGGNRRWVLFDSGTKLYSDGAASGLYAPHVVEDKIKSYSVCYSDSNAPASIATNGVVLVNPSTHNNTWNIGAGCVMVGDRQKTANYPWKGEVYAIRLYNRVLSDSEIAANHALDVERFVAGNFNGDFIRVKGSPSDIGSPTPAYGLTNDLVVGQSYTFTCPAAWTNGAETTGAVCTGWKLVLTNGTETSGSELTKTVVYSDAFAGATLTWQWNVSHKVTATAGSDGTVTNAVQWVKEGETFNTLVQSTASGKSFYRWTDETGAVAGLAPAFSRRITEPHQFTANFKTAYYVSPDGDDENTGTSADDPLLTIQAALDKDPAAVVLLADGVYDVTQTVVLVNSAVIRGISPGAKAVVRAGTLLGSSYYDGNASVLKLTHADAALVNIAVTTKAYGSDGYGRGVWLDGAGTVDGCVIANCFTCYGGNGGGVRMTGSGSIVRNTILDDNAAHSSGGNIVYGGTIHMTDGLVENCTITRGGRQHGASSVSGGIHMSGGIVRNCLIAKCTQGHANTWMANSGGTGVGISGGVLESCTIAGNYKNSDSTYGYGVNVLGACTIRNCIIWGNVNANGTADWWQKVTTYTAVNNCTTYALSDPSNVTDDPSFIDAANGNYRTGLGAGVDKGCKQGWMAGATDLDGRSRILGDAPDMGCYEYVPAGLACGFDVVAGTGLGLADVTFTARVKGTDLTGLVYTWKLVDSLGNETVTHGSDLAEFTMPVPTGIYSVTLTVKNGSGDSGSATKPNVFTVSPKDIYVSLIGTGTYPYGSYAAGTNSLQVALDAAADGSVIHVDDGWYLLADTLKVLKDVTIVAKTAPTNTFIHGTAQTSSMPLISIDSAEAVLSGVTVSGIAQDGTTRPEKWGGLAIGTSGGMVTNCWIVGHKTQSASVNGGGLRVSAGTVVDCVISNNHAVSSGGAGMKGGGIYLTGAALVDRCLIANNYATTGSPGNGGGVYMSAGTVRNCLIKGNQATNYGGGARVDGGQLVNCTVVENTSGTDAAGISRTGGTVVDCLAYNNTANGVKQDMTDPGFVNAAAGDFHLNSASAAVDAGRAADPGELDLERNPRVSGDYADLGCYEYDQSQFSVGIAYKTLGGSFAPMDVEFKAKATPDSVRLDEAQTWWTFDGTEPSAENHGAVGAVVTNNLVPGNYTVRFKTIYKDEPIAIDNANWLLLYGETVYLVSENANAKVPYATRETATTVLSEALKYAIGGATVLIDDGTYLVTGGHDIRRKLTIRSVNGPEKTVINGNGSYRPFCVYNANAVICGLTFKNCDTWDKGGSIYQEAGLVSNCVFYAGRTWNSGGGGVYMTAGTVVDCVFSNCYSRYNNQTGASLVLAGSGAFADRCMVVGSTQSGVQADGAVYVYSGKLRNSLVAYNKPSKNSGVVVGAAGIVENCTVVSNQSAAAGAYVGLSTIAGAQVRNMIAWGNLDSTGATANAAGDGTFDHCSTDGTNPLFRNIARGDWRLKLASPCVNAGTKLDWMTDGATDLRGNPRVRGLVPDLGCYENSYSGLMLLVR